MVWVWIVLSAHAGDPCKHVERTSDSEQEARVCLSAGCAASAGFVQTDAGATRFRLMPDWDAVDAEEAPARTAIALQFADRPLTLYTHKATKAMTSGIISRWLLEAPVTADQLTDVAGQPVETIRVAFGSVAWRTDLSRGAAKRLQRAAECLAPTAETEAEIDRMADAPVDTPPPPTVPALPDPVTPDQAPARFAELDADWQALLALDTTPDLSDLPPPEQNERLAGIVQAQVVATTTLSDALSAIVACGDPEWELQAIVRSAQVYAHLAEVLEQLPAPSNLTDEQQQVYRQMLVDRAQTQHQIAEMAWDEAARRVAELDGEHPLAPVITAREVQPDAEPR